MIARGLLVAFGVGLGLVGLFDLLGDGWSDVGDTLVWLIVGVVVHDALLSGVVLLAGAGVGWLLPRGAVAPVVVGLMVLATVTLAVLPTLLQVGAERYNTSLLDRPYAANWVAFAVLVTLAVIVGGVVRRRRGGAHDWPPDWPRD